MRFLTIILFIFCLNSCSSKNEIDTAKNRYIKLNQAHSAKYSLCIEQKKNVLEKAFTESETPDLDDEYFYFVRNESKALEYIEAFDTNRLTLVENQLEYEASIQACLTPKELNLKTCDTLQPAYKFFRALIFGMYQYHWSASTINKAKLKTLTYLQYVGESNTSLMDLMLVTDLLTRLSNKNFLDKSVKDECIQYRKESEMVFKDLKKEIRKISKKEITCKIANTYYAKERASILDLSEKFRNLLSRVKKI